MGGPGGCPPRSGRPVERCGLLGPGDRPAVPASRAVVVTNPGTPRVVRAASAPGRSSPAGRERRRRRYRGRRRGSGSAAGSACPTARPCWCSSASCTRSRASGMSWRRCRRCARTGRTCTWSSPAGSPARRCRRRRRSAFRAELAELARRYGAGEAVTMTGYLPDARGLGAAARRRRRGAAVHRRRHQQERCAARGARPRRADGGHRADDPDAGPAATAEPWR